MRFYFHPKADDELDEAVKHYEQCRVGLGLEFSEEVYVAIARVLEYPEGYSSLSENTRSCLVNRFPYGVIFQVKFGKLRIVAVANLHRRPGYWHDRI